MNMTARWAVALLALAATAYLILEHRPHLGAFLPYAILLACPLMHLFMHGGHGGHHSPPNRKEPR